jgi:hypothetical protein
MKPKNINQKIEDIAKKHINIVFTESMDDIHEVTNVQIENALKAAYLLGEKTGYKHGFKDAKVACDCILEKNIK